MARGNNRPPPSPDQSSGSGSSSIDPWSRAMVLALTAKNKSCFVDGSAPRPPNTDLLFSAWNRCNSMVISWILNSVSKAIADNLVYIPNASEGSRDVNFYYTKLKILCDELQAYIPTPSCTCRGLRQLFLSQQQHDALQFLMGLNDSFSSVRAQILLMDPLPSIACVFSLVLQEERQRQINITLPQPPDTPLLNSISNLPTPIPSADSNSGPPTTAAFFNRLSRPFCTHCNKEGHGREKCFRLHGFPPGY
ncbi:uncharacterized protein LOC133285052 [Gastrolobium bilobum]|uniref:uncharacterized protein LOC133285052 n=1 Tax=Gastrolobium bilobum TaxID=150636 RepID=UPI002AAFBE53|nr:uncharacterized protein LOC133285052 [Gastrolobium bilobum]